MLAGTPVTGTAMYVVAARRSVTSGTADMSSAKVDAKAPARRSTAEAFVS
jgi:hypothetical protein